MSPSDSRYPKEKEHYERLWLQFATYRPPNRQRPPTSRDHNGWGIHPNLAAPQEALRFVAKMFTDEIARRPGQSLRPQIRYWILMSVNAHFLWFLEKEGAQWVLNVSGVMETPPFLSAYMYIYRNPASRVDVLLNSEKQSLRIFDTCKPNYEPAVRQSHKRLANGGPIHQRHIDIMAKLRLPEAARESMNYPTPAYSHYISGFISDWFTKSPTTRSHTAYWDDVRRRKQSGKSRGPFDGHEWAMSLMRTHDQPFYPALHQLHKYQPKKKRVYRLSNANGAPMWCNTPDLRDPAVMSPEEKQTALRTPTVIDMPLMEYLQRFRGLSRENADKTFTCTTCGNRRTCVPSNGNGEMCCHCYGSVVESDVRGTLDWCTSWECRACPDHISSRGALIELKNALNQRQTYPIHRTA